MIRSLKNNTFLRKGFSVVNSLRAMIENFRESLDQGEAFRAFFIDLSKALNRLRHELLIAILHAYGLDISSLILIHSYLTKKTKSKLMFLALGQKYILVFLKVQLLTDFYLIYLFFIFLWLFLLIILLIMQMTTLLI